MKKVSGYQASDGMYFDEKQDCIEYETVNSMHDKFLLYFETRSEHIENANIEYLWEIFLKFMSDNIILISKYSQLYKHITNNIDDTTTEAVSSLTKMDNTKIIKNIQKGETNVHTTTVHKKVKE